MGLLVVCGHERDRRLLRGDGEVGGDVGVAKLRLEIVMRAGLKSAPWVDIMVLLKVSTGVQKGNILYLLGKSTRVVNGPIQ